MYGNIKLYTRICHYAYNDDLCIDCSYLVFIWWQIYFLIIISQNVRGWNNQLFVYDTKLGLWSNPKCKVSWRNILLFVNYFSLGTYFSTLRYLLLVYYCVNLIANYVGLCTVSTGCWCYCLHQKHGLLIWWASLRQKTKWPLCPWHSCYRMDKVGHYYY